MTKAEDTSSTVDNSRRLWSSIWFYLFPVFTLREWCSLRSQSSTSGWRTPKLHYDHPCPNPDFFQNQWVRIIHFEFSSFLLAGFIFLMMFIAIRASTSVHNVLPGQTEENIRVARRTGGLPPYDAEKLREFEKPTQRCCRRF